MALSPAQKTAVAALIVQEGGLSAFFTAVQSASIASQNAASLAALASMISVTVTDLPGLKAAIAAGTDAGGPAIMAAITSDIAADTTTRLGPLLAGLYIALKARGIG